MILKRDKIRISQKIIIRDICKYLGIVYIMETPDDTRVHRERTIRKGQLVVLVGHALQGSISRRGSSILEGTGVVDSNIEKPLVTVKMISSCKTPAGPMNLVG